MGKPKVFGSASWTLDKVWDKETGTFYVPFFPPIPEKKCEEDYQILIKKILEMKFVKLIQKNSEWKLAAQMAKDSNGFIPITLELDSTVAVIDTGILSRHPMLKNKIVDAVDLTGEGIEDAYGHGTFVALGLVTDRQIFQRALSYTYNVNIMDVAVPLRAYCNPKLQIINVKVMDNKQNCKDEWIVEGIRYSIRKGANAINLAIGWDKEGCYPDHKSICEAIKEAYNSNCVVSVPSEARCPSECPYASVAGGMRADGSRMDSEVTPTSYGVAEFTMVPYKKE